MMNFTMKVTEGGRVEDGGRNLRNFKSGFEMAIKAIHLLENSLNSRRFGGRLFEAPLVVLFQLFLFNFSNKNFFCDCFPFN